MKAFEIEQSTAASFGDDLQQLPILAMAYDVHNSSSLPGITEEGRHQLQMSGDASVSLPNEESALDSLSAGLSVVILPICRRI